MKVSREDDNIMSYYENDVEFESTEMLEDYKELSVQLWLNIQKMATNCMTNIEVPHHMHNEYESSFDCENGPATLVHQSQKATNYSASDLSEEDVRTHFMYAALCYNISANDRDILYGVISGAMRSTDRKNSINDNNMGMTKANNEYKVRTNIPMHEKDIRRNYLIGCDSIVENLPIPNVNVLNGHAYVSIKDVIRHMLSFDIAVEPILPKSPQQNNISRRTETVISQNIYYRIHSIHPRDSIFIFHHHTIIKLSTVAIMSTRSVMGSASVTHVAGWAPPTIPNSIGENSIKMNDMFENPDLVHPTSKSSSTNSAKTHVL